MEVAYKLVPYMEYAAKLNAYHIESLEKKYNQYKEDVQKNDPRSHLYSHIQGEIDGIEAAMMSIGYEFVEEKEKQ
jgi:hypothetical protein